MAGLAKKASTLLSKGIKKIAGDAFGAVIGKGIDFIFGDNTEEINARSDENTAKLQTSINDVLTEVKQVQEEVKKVAVQMEKFMLTLRKDGLNVQLAAIDESFKGIYDCFQSALRVKKDPTYNPKELSNQLRNIQKRLNVRLRTAFEPVSTALAQVNVLLDDADFIRQLATDALASSNDLLTYYVSVKSMVMSYWIVVIKGVHILEMASLALPDEYPEAQETIARHKAAVLAQESTFKAVLGHQTYNLCEALLEASGKRVCVAWYTSWGSNIDLIDRIIQSSTKTPTSTTTSVTKVFGAPNDTYGKEVRGQFWLEVSPAVSNDFNVQVVHAMRICRSKDTQEQLEKHPDPSNTMGMLVQAPSNNSLLWVKPLSVGSDNYQFRLPSSNQVVVYPHGAMPQFVSITKDHPSATSDRALFKLVKQG